MLNRANVGGARAKYLLISEIYLKEEDQIKFKSSARQVSEKTMRYGSREPMSTLEAKSYRSKLDQSECSYLGDIKNLQKDAFYKYKLG
jgi:hypothetical protein